MTGGQDFWSRRKARVAAEAQAEAASVQAQEIAAEQALLDEQSDEEVLARFDLPDPDSLKPGDDFSAFLKAAVPERIRRRALRRLWVSNPLLANLDDLVDYGEDYTDAATVIENLQSAYQVGKGMLRHVKEIESDPVSTEDQEVAGAVESDVVAEPDEYERADGEPDLTEQLASAPVSEPAAEGGQPVARRRMRFDFANEAQTHEEHV